MLWTIFVILLVLWLLGMVSSYTFGGFIHILLVIALAIVLIQRDPRSASGMKPAAIVGLVLIVLGIVGFAVGRLLLHSQGEGGRPRADPGQRRQEGVRAHSAGARRPRPRGRRGPAGRGTRRA